MFCKDKMFFLEEQTYLHELQKVLAFFLIFLYSSAKHPKGGFVHVLYRNN